jgi:hypothetical protein
MTEDKRDTAIAHWVELLRKWQGEPSQSPAPAEGEAMEARRDDD